MWLGEWSETAALKAAKITESNNRIMSFNQRTIKKQEINYFSKVKYSSLFNVEFSFW